LTSVCYRHKFDKSLIGIIHIMMQPTVFDKHQNVVICLNYYVTLLN